MARNKLKKNYGSYDYLSVVTPKPYISRMTKMRAIPQLASADSTRIKRVIVTDLSLVIVRQLYKRALARMVVAQQK